MFSLWPNPALGQRHAYSSLFMSTIGRVFAKPAQSGQFEAGAKYRNLIRGGGYGGAVEGYCK